jgi:hypothetical protein
MIKIRSKFSTKAHILSLPPHSLIFQRVLIFFVLLFSLMLFSKTAFAQDPKFNQVAKDRMKDNFDEADKDVLTLRFNDALSGNPVKDGDVEIKAIGKFTTDFEGKVQFPIPEEDGYYAVSFRKEGYIETDFKIEIVAGTIFFNRISVSPKMNIKQIRVVLDWDAEPRDLDAHFKKRGGYHLSYRNMRTLADGQGQLDRVLLAPGRDAEGELRGALGGIGFHGEGEPHGHGPTGRPFR